MKYYLELFLLGWSSVNFILNTEVLVVERGWVNDSVNRWCYFVFNSNKIKVHRRDKWNDMYSVIVLRATVRQHTKATSLTLIAVAMRRPASRKLLLFLKKHRQALTKITCYNFTLVYSDISVHASYIIINMFFRSQRP